MGPVTKQYVRALLIEKMISSWKGGWIRCATM